jgi:tetratricopeptide (TPR) repeat protein
VQVEDGPYLRELVRRLDGLPLAIELAAAQAGDVAPEWALDQIRVGAVGVAEAAWRDVPERHTSLDLAVAWSWDLLDPREQRALLAFSILSGWFLLDLAEVTLGGGESLDVIHRLVLVGLVEVDRPTRSIRLFDAVRRFAALRAADDPGLDEERARQLAWFDVHLTPKSPFPFISLAAGVVLKSRGPAAFALARRLLVQATSSRNRAALAEMILRETEDPEARIHALVERAKGLRYLGRDQEAREAALEAVSTSNERWIGSAWLELAHAERQVGDYEAAEQCFRRALDLATPWQRGEVAHGLATFYRYLARPSEALVMYDEAVRGYEQAGRVHLANGCRLSALDGSSEPDVVARVDEIAARMRADGAPPGRLAFTLAWRALALGRTGRLAEALVENERAAIALRELEFDVPWVEVQGYRAWTLALLGHHDEALAVLDHAGRGQHGHLGALVALWRALVLARRRDPGASQALREVREVMRVPPTSQYGLWMRLAEAWIQGDDATVRALAAPEPAGHRLSLPFGILP